MIYTQGQVIRASLTDLPLIYHYGIISINEEGNTMVMHNTYEDSVLIESIDDFLVGRDIVEVKDSNLSDLSYEELSERFSNCYGEFDTINYNCEHFIDCMRGKELHSEQLYRITAITTISLVLYYLYTRD